MTKDEWIATLEHQKDIDAEAIARLRAQREALLAALKRLLADAVYDAERSDEAIAAVAQAQAAIAKAR